MHALLRSVILSLGALGLAVAVATAQVRLEPLALSDLPRLAKGAGPKSAELLLELAKRAAEETKEPPFEQVVLDRLAEFVPADASRERLWTAEKILRATLRFHDDRVAALPGADKEPLTLQLRAKLKQVRARLLTHPDEEVESVAWADLWLPLYPGDGELRDAVRLLWIRQAEQHLKKGEHAAATRWLARLDGEFIPNPPTQALRRSLQQHVETRYAALQKSGDDAETLRKLLEINSYWPRLPGLHDEIARRQKTYQTLRVAVPSLPTRLSPATACTNTERQCLEMLFEGLVRRHNDPSLGRRFVPQLALRLPPAEGSHRSFTLRPDAFWSDGEPLTAADVRHTALLNGGEARWRDVLEVPRFDGQPHALTIELAQPLATPLSALDFHLLPRSHHGKPLKSADDAEFAKAPVGSGPFLIAEVSKAEKAPFVRLRANPWHVRDGGAHVQPIREIHLSKWEEGIPLPQFVWDVSADQVETWKKRGHAVRSLPGADVQMLLFNPRRLAMTNASLRRAIAHAVQRKAILTEVFHCDAKEAENQCANGPFPRDSWAAAPAPRVPASLDEPEQARVFARRAKQEVGDIEFTLAYLGEDATAALACTKIVQQIQRVASEIKWKVVGKLQPVPSAQWRRVLHERSYDLAYVDADSLDDPLRLWLLFDPLGESALAPNDAKLIGMLRSAVAQRQFDALRENMQRLHVHLHETMPLVPLWQRDVRVAVHPSLQTPPLDAGRVFARVNEWKLKGSP